MLCYFPLSLYLQVKLKIFERIEEESVWRYQFEDLLLGPKKAVIDINPGTPYATSGCG